MHPDLISIGFLHIKTYGACMALGFLVAWQVVSWLCRRTGRNAEPLSNLLMLMMVTGIVGARAAYVIEHWSSEFAAHPGQIIRVDQGGLMFYGGLIAAALVLAAYAAITRQHLFTITDLVLAVLPLGHAFGRVGCFLHGCCFGRLTDSCLGVSFPRGSPAWWEQVSATPPLLPQTAAESLPVLPTQLFEAAANAVLFAVLYQLYRRHHAKTGLVTGSYLIGYAVLRFANECLRGDPRLAVGPFTIGQTISLGLLLFGSGCLFRAVRRARRRDF